MPVSTSRITCVLLLLLPSLVLAGNFEQGVDALDRGAYDQAVACFTACIRENPADAVAFTDRGIAHAGKQEIRQGHRRLHRGHPPQSARSPSSSSTAGIAHADKKEYGRAIADYTEAISLDPRTAAAFYYRGNAYADKKEYDDSHRRLHRGSQLDPKDAVAFNNRGIAHGNKKAYVRPTRTTPRPCSSIRSTVTP